MELVFADLEYFIHQQGCPRVDLYLEQVYLSSRSKVIGLVVVYKHVCDYEYINKIKTSHKNGSNIGSIV